jgi:ribose transport system ATP-binding protein
MADIPPSSELLEITGLVKVFGGNRALDGAHLSMKPGEIRALIGQNGCGKSTTIKILAGFYTADEGEIRLHGEQVRLPMTQDTLARHGVTFLHQDLGLVPTMSVLENLRIGTLRSTGGRIAWRKERAVAAEVLRKYGLDVDPRIPVSRLSQTQQTILGMVRALEGVGDREHGLIVLDEPTSALPAGEVEALFAAMRIARDHGHGLILVTHHIDEVFRVCDSVSVFRAGRHIATKQVAETTEKDLIESMIGGILPDLPTPGSTGASRQVVLAVEGLSGRVSQDVSLEVRAGEILGLTGLLGAGQEEIPYLVYGGARATAGTVTVDGEQTPRPTPYSSRKRGIALLPSDRKTQSGIQTATMRENASLPKLRRLRRLWGIDGRAEKKAASDLLERFDVRPHAPSRPLSSFSGGNQQKALLGRWIEENPKLLFLDEPSNGVDVGARQQIFAELQECAKRGMAIVIASSQHDDIAAVCTRALVFSRGRVVDELHPGGMTADALLAACFRAESLPA